jgi:hypothetical protein
VAIADLEGVCDDLLADLVINLEDTYPQLRNNIPGVESK